MVRLTVPIDGISLMSTLQPIAFMRGDPTVRLSPGRFERATTTPQGPGVITVLWETDSAATPTTARTATVTASGPGGHWLLARAPGLLGLLDDPSGFEPAGPPLRKLWQAHRGDRITRTGTLWHDLAWLIVQQRVSGLEAAENWRRLVRGLGEPAPGSTLLLPPAREVVADLAYHDFHRFGIERQRADALRRAAAAVGRLAGTGAETKPETADRARTVLLGVPGIGQWTVGYLSAQTWGDADALILGDYGIPSLVSWLLTGEEKADDARLVDLLEPYRPHRYRVVKLAYAAGLQPPRRHHRGRRHDIRKW